jgi:hypothetical protein
MARVGVDPTRRTTKNSKRTTRTTVKNWGTDPKVKVARKAHQRKRGTKKKTLVLEVLELAQEMIDGTLCLIEKDLESIETSRKSNATGKSSSWSLSMSEV